MSVIDANVAVIALIGSDEAAMLAHEKIVEASVLHAPAHFVSEVMGAIRWHATGNRITWADADAAIDTLKDLSITLNTPTSGDIDRAWELRHNITPQDGLYVALAERLGEPFITGDGKLIRSKQLRCTVHSLS